MTTTSSYMAAARAYADGVRTLFAPSGTAVTERGGRGPVSHEDLARQAETLLPLSSYLTRAAAAEFASADPDARIQASTHLLAKALTDLQVSAYLLQAAVDEEDKVAWATDAVRERSGVGREDIEESLKILLDETEAGPEMTERGKQLPADIPAARVALSNSIKDALDLILERASKTGQSALAGLLGMGVAELAQAAGSVGMDVAQAFGQAEKVTRLYNLFRDFVMKAYDSVIALLGQSLAQTAAKLVLEWVDDLKKGKLFGELLEKLYQTKQAGQDLGRLVSDSPAPLEKFTASIQGVERLNENYRKQSELVGKLLRGLKYLGSVPAAALPWGRLLLATVYVVLGSYVVLTGADYVDAPRLTLLDRVPGVRRAVAINLSAE